MKSGQYAIIPTPAVMDFLKTCYGEVAKVTDLLWGNWCNEFGLYTTKIMTQKTRKLTARPAEPVEKLLAQTVHRTSCRYLLSNTFKTQSDREPEVQFSMVICIHPFL